MPQPQDNIALGKIVTFNTKPNYADTNDPDDSKQLTDGKYSSGIKVLDDNTTIKSIWGQTSTVGWQRVTPVVITIDFGSVQPISGVSFGTGAGTAGVTWSTAIYMAVSNDNKTWRAAGDLVPLSRVNGAPPEKGYAAFRYVTHNLHTAGRYISLAVMATPFVFADEIEVFKGDDAWINQPVQGEIISDFKEYANNSLIRSAAQRRLYDDISAIKKEIDKTQLSASRKSTFKARLDKDASKAAQMPQLGRDYKTILPLDDTHRDILAVRGELLAAQGIAPLTIWKMHRYSWLPFLAKPNTANKPQLNFSMLRHQFRSDDMLLTNASGNSQEVTLQLNNAPKNAQNGWLQIYSVAWTDTSQGTPVANALIPVEEKNNAFVVNVPAGMTRRVWFTIDSSKLPAGNYKSTFAITSGDQFATVPINLDISQIAMHKPRLSLSMWDGTEGNGSYGITPRNRQSAIALMRSHYVNTPWTNGRGIPLPKDSDFDAYGNLKSKLDFSTLDEWIAMWPGAERYMIFSNVPDNIADAKINTPEFKLRVESWAKALSQHMKELGLKPEQLGILLVDEPHQESQDAIVAAWANAMKAAAPELTLFSDPTWPRPDQTKDQNALTLMDILCPNLPIYINGGEPVKKYFSNLRDEGKKLWLYQCAGPTWEFDPQLYFRYQAWHAFSASATGEAFWSFGDIGRAPTSWNGYSNTGVVYSPVYLGETTVASSIHWDAVREGVEDYEELAMLQDAINASKDAAWKQQAQQVLDGAIKTVTGIWKIPYDWQQKSNEELADRQLRKVRAMLDNRL
jgi:hypothetical protein